MPLVWWRRWQVWLQAQRSHRLHAAWRTSGGKAMQKWTAADKADYFWAMTKDDG